MDISRGLESVSLQEHVDQFLCEMICSPSCENLIQVGANSLCGDQ